MFFPFKNNISIRVSSTQNSAICKNNTDFYLAGLELTGGKKFDSDLNRSQERNDPPVPLSFGFIPCI